jgi:hypothetical protein
MAFFEKVSEYQKVFAKKKFHRVSCARPQRQQQSGGNELVLRPRKNQLAQQESAKSGKKKLEKLHQGEKNTNLLNSGARRWRTLESHKRHQNKIKWNVLKYIWSSFVYFTQMRPRALAYVIHT